MTLYTQSLSCVCVPRHTHTHSTLDQITVHGRARHMWRSGVTVCQRESRLQGRQRSFRAYIGGGGGSTAGYVHCVARPRAARRSTGETLLRCTVLVRTLRGKSAEKAANGLSRTSRVPDCEVRVCDSLSRQTLVSYTHTTYIQHERPHSYDFCSQLSARGAPAQRAILGKRPQSTHTMPALPLTHRRTRPRAERTTVPSVRPAACHPVACS